MMYRFENPWWKWAVHYEKNLKKIDAAFEAELDYIEENTMPKQNLYGCRHYKGFDK